MSLPKEIFLSEILVHRLRVLNFRALQHAKEKNRQPDEVEARMIAILEKTDTSKPNRHLSFFQGFPPWLQNLNDDQTI
jgi:hypothetical protein